MPGDAGEVRAGGAYVDIRSKSTKYDAGMKRVFAQLSTLRDKAKIAAMALTAVGTAMAGAIFKITNSFAEYGDTIAKIAARTGASVQFIAQMGHVAELAGQDVGQLEKALRGLQRAMFDAKRGSAEIVDALAELGLTYDDLAGLPFEQQFLLILERLGQMSNASLKAAVAMKIFGRAGAAMVPVADMGAEAIGQMRKEFDLLMGGLSDKTAKAAEDYLDWLSRMKTAITGLKGAIADQLMPIFVELYTTIVSYIVALREMIKAHPELIGQFVALTKVVLAAAGMITGLWVALMMMTTTIGPIILIALSVLEILKALGLVEHGVTDLMEHMRIGTHTMAGYWDWLGDTIVYYMAGAFTSLKNFFVDLYDIAMIVVTRIVKGFSWGLNKLGLLSTETYDEIARQADKAKLDIGKGIEARWEKERFAPVDAIKKARDERFAKDKARAAQPNFFDRLKSDAAKAKQELLDLIAGAPKPDLDTTIPGVPDKVGVHGFFGSQRVSEQLGAAMGGGKSVEENQLTEQKQTNELLKEILGNARKQNTDNEIGFATT